jgi:hypothetical protein
VGGRQHQATDTARLVVRELLDDGSAVRVAQHVSRLHVEMVEDGRRELCERRDVDRIERRARTARARRVEGQDAAVGKLARERSPHVRVATDARHEQEGFALTRFNHVNAMPAPPEVVTLHDPLLETGRRHDAGSGVVHKERGPPVVSGELP